MNPMFFGKVVAFLTLLINAMTGVREVINPILGVIEQIKGIVREGKGSNDPEVKNLTEGLPAILKAKVNKALPKAIKNLGIPLEEKGNVVKSFITYVEAQPDPQRSGLYSKLASHIYREVEGKVSEVEADTLIQLHYLKGKMSGGFAAGMSAGPNAEETGDQSPDA